MPPKQTKQTTSSTPKPVPETAHDIAALATPTASFAPETASTTTTSSLATTKPEPIVPLNTPEAVKSATDTIIQAAKKPLEPSTAVPLTVPPPATTVTTSTPTPAPKPVSNAVTPATTKPTNEEIATVRSILIRRIRKYQELFKEETKDIIPGSITGLNNDQLGAICIACDSTLGDCFGRDAIGAGIFAVLQALESWALPLLPRGQYYMGVSVVAEHLMKRPEQPDEKETPLSRAMDRLAIKHMGKIETSAEIGLVLCLWTVFQETYKMNEQRMGPYQPPPNAYPDKPNQGGDYAVDYSSLS